MYWMKLSRKSWLFIFALLVMSLPNYAANTIKGVRVWPAKDNTRVVFDLNQKPEYSYFSLANPQRLVIDFKNSRQTLSLNKVADNDQRITKIRTSTAKNKSSTRLVFELSQSFKVKVFPLAPEGQYGHRLVVDLSGQIQAKTSITSSATKNKQPIKVSKPKPNVVKTNQPHDKRDIVIGVIAGHGGKDPGSIGPRGTYEKHVTLAIAKRLQTLITREKGMKAIMLRTGDYYVGLDRKTELARKQKVDFLVSIHADAFTTPQPRGASVWVVSDRRAKSELAKWLDKRQQKSELLGGGGEVIKTTKDDNLALTLADMNREHSLEVSIGVSKNVLSQLKKITRLHKKDTQYKSLAVLKASDIPSILIETGFISNPTEERNLTSSSHQQKLANAIHNGIKDYFLANPLAGSYFASIGYRKHKVSNGESLSLLSKRYNISIARIKSANNLRSNIVRIGQTLKIPRV